MIIAGYCLFDNMSRTNSLYRTAGLLKGIVDGFRCKLWGGGTTPEKYMGGVGEKGLPVLQYINDNIMPAGTEVQTPEHVVFSVGLSYIWVGARNSQNYGLLKSLRNYEGDVFIKRGAGMLIDEVYGIYDIMKDKYNKEVYIIERGINTFDRIDKARWTIDLRSLLRIKNERKDIFSRLMVDCSHGAGDRNYINDIYKATKVIGIKHHMFECYDDISNTQTDKEQAITTFALKKIIGVK